MPKVSSVRLQQIGEALLTAAGALPEEAAIVTRHLVASNLAGVDSHGVSRIPEYMDRLGKKHIVPGAPFQIKQETATTTVVDGNWGFGYVITEKTMQITIDKARASGGVAAATVAHQGHIGRLAAYTVMAAEQGMIGLITADSGRSPKNVVPFGGREKRLGTNPLSIAVPSLLDGPLFIDFSTSASIPPKISSVAKRGEQIPAGWAIDAQGRPTTDPAKYAQGGGLLPLGGNEGHKGYGLAVIVEILCGLLPGLGFGVEPSGKHNDGCFLAVFDVEKFLPLAIFKKEVADFAKYLKDTPPSEGSKGVIYPGEMEWKTECERSTSGIEIKEDLWKKLSELAAPYGLGDRVQSDL